MKNFSFRERQSHLEKFSKEDFDLLIIGGGITGAGAARDAAARGMRVALIEANDFASGTSSRSSKLIHGGIRYLENMEFKLVFEALNERSKLFEMAPHLVHPLRFMIPLYKNSRVGMLKMGLGMWLYDALALFQAPEMHERLDASESIQRMSAIQASELEGSYIYSDAYMDDDRLVHETLRSASEGGACCVNYVKAVGVEFDSAGQITHVECLDQISQKKFKIKATHVVSSVGPWTDQVAHSFFKEWKDVLRPTKGIHLTLSKDRLPLSSAVVMAAEKSDRIIFAIPRHEMVIVGTTDTDFKNSPEKVSVTPEDVKYLLEVLSQYFPGAKITAQDIIASYAGVRPLVKDESSSEGKTSREHVILSDPRGITFVAGGKYTTYRLMAEQVIDAALQNFKFDHRARFKKGDTTQALNSYTNVDAFRQAQSHIDVWSKQFARPLAEVRLLAQRYGLEAEKIMDQFPSTSSYWQLEAYQAIENTMCLHLVDFYSRRAPLFLARRDHGLPFLEEISHVFQSLLHWSDEQKASEQQRVRSYMDQELDWKKHLR